LAGLFRSRAFYAAMSNGNIKLFWRFNFVIYLSSSSPSHTAAPNAFYEKQFSFARRIHSILFPKKKMSAPRLEI